APDLHDPGDAGRLRGLVEEGQGRERLVLARLHLRPRLAVAQGPAGTCADGEVGVCVDDRVRQRVRDRRVLPCCAGPRPQADSSAGSTGLGETGEGAGSCVPAGTGVSMSANIRAPSSTPSRSRMRAVDSGMTGCTSRVTTRTTSSTTASTVAMRAGSVFLSLQGSCPLM